MRYKWLVNIGKYVSVFYGGYYSDIVFYSRQNGNYYKIYNNKYLGGFGYMSILYIILGINLVIVEINMKVF